VPGPDVFKYLDYRQFMEDAVQHRSADREARGRSAYSFAMLARDAGLGRATLNNVILGKRVPTQDTITRFSEAMGLGDEERGYLWLLVQLKRAPDMEARCEVLEDVLGHVRTKTQRDLQAVDPAYVANWHMTAIRELARVEPEFTPDPAWLMERLRFEVSREQVEAALALLEAEGLLEEGDAPVRMDTEGEAEGGVYFDYHRDVLRLAVEGLAIDPDERYYCAGTLTVQPRHLPAMRLEVEQFVRGILNRFEQTEAAAEEDASSVYQLNIQLFPLTVLKE